MRIITGAAKGCRLNTLRGRSTRPTADRVKESVFNILGAMVEGRTVLDVFAGTGNLGLEALSRGAAWAVFIDKTTAALIKKNASHTKLAARSEILSGDAERVLSRLDAQGRAFDLIFADPPYGANMAGSVLTFLDRGKLLALNGIFVLEHGGFAETNLVNLALVRRESYGVTTKVDFYQRIAWLEEKN